MYMNFICSSLLYAAIKLISCFYIQISVVPILGFAYNSDTDIIGN